MTEFRAAGPPAEAVRGRPGGIGRSTSRRAEAVSDSLRRQAGGFLEQRRSVIRRTLLATGALGVVAAYQTGILKHIPDPPVSIFDSDAVDAAGEAYNLAEMPDAILGMLSALVTAGLASMGPKDRADHRPWLPLALAGKAALDAAWAARLSAEQASKHRRFCFWCLTAALSQIAALPATIPEARAALGGLKHRF